MNLENIRYNYENKWSLYMQHEHLDFTGTSVTTKHQPFLTRTHVKLWWRQLSSVSTSLH